MAENRVRVTIVADGRTATEVVRNLNTELGRTDSEARQAGSGMRELSRHTDGAASSLNSLGAIAKTAIGYFAVGYLKSHIQEVSMLAARYDTLGVVMDVVGNNAGYSRLEMDQFDANLRKTGISALESRNNLAKMASANIDLAKSTELARLAQDAAVIGNMNSSEAFQHMIYGIQSAQVEVLRTIGINVNFENSYKTLASQLGKTSAELTESEKTQARLNAVLAQAPSIAGVYEASLDTVGKKLGSTERLAENAKVKLGEVFQPAMILLVDTYTDALKGVNETLSDTSAIEHWADVVKSEVLDIMQIAVSMNMVLAKAGETASAVGMAVYGPGSALGIENSERGFEYFAKAHLDYEAQYTASEEKLNRLITEQDKLFRQKTGADRDAASASEQRRISTALAAKKEAAETETKYSEASQKKQTAELDRAIKERNALYAKQADNTKNTELQYFAGLEKANERAVQIINDRYDDEEKAADRAAEYVRKLQEKELEEQREHSQKFLDSITDATADVFYDMFRNIGSGWSNLWSSMKSWALKILAQIAAQAAATQIVMPVVMAATGTSTTSAAVSALSGGSGTGGIFANLPVGSILSKIPGMSAVSGLLGSVLPGTAISYGGEVASLAAAEAGLTGATGLTLGSALSMGGLGGLGYSLLGGYVGLPQNKYSGITSSLGGALGAWGGTALAGTAGAALGATAGSVVPIVGTAVGAILGGLAGSLFGGDEQSPSVIFQKQQTGWGQTTGLQYHTKDGGSNETGDQISAVLGQYMGTVFDAVEASLGTVGDQYVSMLDSAVIEWGRKAGGSWSAWDFGSDMDIEELMAKAQSDLKSEIYEAAAGAFTAAGQAIASDTDTTSALAMLSGKAAESMQTLLDAIKSGVQSGDVEAYAAKITALQTAIGTVNSAWDSISTAASEMVKPLTAYESAVKQANAQFDGWEASLKQLGFSSEKIAEIEDKRAATLARLNVEMGKEFEREQASAARVSAAQEALSAARSALVSSYNAERAALTETISAWDRLSENLRTWRDNFVSSSDMPSSQRALISEQRWSDVSARARLGDVDAISELTAVATDQLASVKDQAATQEDYLRAVAKTFGVIEDVESLAGRQADVAVQQLDTMTAQLTALGVLNESVLSIADAIAQFDAAKIKVGAANASAVTGSGVIDSFTGTEISSSDVAAFNPAAYLTRKTAQLNAIKQGGVEWNEASAMAAIKAEGMTLWDHYLKYGRFEGINGFASGGIHSGGLRIVGENGPELESTGPSMIWSATETRNILSGGPGAENIVDEIRQLRSELQAANRAIAQNTIDTAKILKRWNGDGMPEVRVA